MSGAVVFAGEIVVGVISEHHRPEGSSSLTVVPITAIDLLPDAEEWWRLLRSHPSELILLPVPDGLYVWTASDFAAGLQVTDHPAVIAPIEPDEPVTAAMLRQGRLPNLQREFGRLTSAFDDWLRPDPWSKVKRGDEPLRVFWLDGDWGPERSKARLACLSRANAQGRAVYDAATDLTLGTGVLKERIVTAGFGVPPLVSVDLDAEEVAEPWRTVRTAVLNARNRFTSSSGDHLRGDDPYPRVLVTGTRAQGEAVHKVLSGLVHIEPYDLRGNRGKRPYSYGGLSSMASQTLTDDAIYNRGLPITTRNLIGREDEIEELERAWSSKQTRIISVVAQGGAGKSALINEWLRQMRDKDYLGASRVFAWSFYSQGTRENMVSADPFVSAAWDWLGDDSPVSLNPRQRGLQLASQIKKHKFLLVLDGMEPLQHPLQAPHVGGQFTDESIRALLEELAKPDWRGLCLITTRVPLTDLSRFQDDGPRPEDAPTVVQMDLENLTDHDGAVLLKSLIQRDAPRRELERAVREVDGHALAITLLGNYIRDVHDGDLAGRFDLEGLTVAAREGGHARRIMASYAQWLGHHEQWAELAVLSLIGLFDRPAPPEAMDALLTDASMAPFTAQLENVQGEDWSAAVGALREMGLLSRAIPEWPGTLDAHPLVREHFREQVRSNDPEIWIHGNRALFDFYMGEAPPLPETAGEMNALYASVTHGCASQLYQQVFDQVLLPRIWRDRRTSFSTRRLGTTGSDLAALSNYFYPRQWKELRTPSLTPRARVLILTNAGVRLRQLGRLPEARECFGTVIDEITTEAAAPEELEDASYAAAQNCELLVIAGKLTDSKGESGDERNVALLSARRAIEYADGGDPYFKMHAHSTLGEVHFMLGDLEGAHRLFQEAMAIEQQSDPKPKPPFLYSQSLFRYGYYLVETGHAATILSDAVKDPAWGTNAGDSSLLSEAIRLMVLGAAHRALIEDGVRDRAFLAAAERTLDQSINAFKTAGYADYTVRGLLERANFYWVHGGSEYFQKSLKDLDDAIREADRGQMELLRADIFLQRVACYLRYRRTMMSSDRAAIDEKITDSVSHAAEAIEEIGYGRRSAMLAGLQEAAREAGIVI
jgi:tetratricopeptide (TPR) repeat protein